MRASLDFEDPWTSKTADLSCDSLNKGPPTPEALCPGLDVDLEDGEDQGDGDGERTPVIEAIDLDDFPNSTAKRPQEQTDIYLLDGGFTPTLLACAVHMAAPPMASAPTFISSQYGPYDTNIFPLQSTLRYNDEPPKCILGKSSMKKSSTVSERPNDIAPSV